jgi:hypothetical protein
LPGKEVGRLVLKTPAGPESPVPSKEVDSMSVYSNHFPEAIWEANRDPSVPAGEPLDDWPDERWGLCFPDDAPEDEDVVLVPQEGGA